MTTVVRGYTGLMRALSRADRDVRFGVRAELRNVAKPIADDAERRAVAEITRIGPKWSRMRVGVTSKVVYVAPKERGTRSRGLKGRKRKDLAGLLMDRSMQPALEANQDNVERALEQMLGRAADNFSR